MYGKHANLWLVLIVALIVFGGIALLEGPVTVTGNVVADNQLTSLPSQQTAAPEPSTSSCQDFSRGTVQATTENGVERFSTYCGSETELFVVSCTGSGKVSYTAITCPSGTTCVRDACI